MTSYCNGEDWATLAIQVLLAFIGAWWYLYWILQAIPAGQAWLNKINSYVEWRFLGARGSTFLFQAMPIFIVSLVAYVVIELRKRRRLRTLSRESRNPKVNIWTLPIILRSPLGMLTLADLVFIFVTIFVVSFYLIKSIIDESRTIDSQSVFPGEPLKWHLKLEKAGLHFGLSAMIPFQLLWIPVSRGSPVLRLAGVPFERAVKYHTWLGQLTVSLLVVHGACFITFFSLIHHPDILLHWNKLGVSIIPGWLALAAGLVMFVSALGGVRRKYFDIFFTAHHLYLAFLILFSLHVASFVYIYVVPVLLFFIDRFLRIVQSRKGVDVLSARVLRSGAMEFTFAKPSSMEYFPLSFVYVLFTSVSRFEWHPFSVASSPLDSANQMSIYIKPLGGYTKNLHRRLISSSQSKDPTGTCPFSFKLSLEGPYGDESSFYLKYNTLILVAGGIGITPIIAVIRDIMHRHRLLEEDIPTDIQLLYCVRSPKEMSILDTMNFNELCPNYAERVNIVVRPYVTSKILPQNKSTDGRADAYASSYDDFSYVNVIEPVIEVLGKPIAEAKAMSAIHATGHNVWLATTVFSTMVGFFVLWGIFHVTIIDEKSPSYLKALLFFTCMFLAVTVVGGGVTFLRSLSLKRKARDNKRDNKVASRGTSPATGKGTTAPGCQDTNSSTEGAAPWLGNVIFGSRPDWKDLFQQLAKQYEGRNVGVLVSGVSKMQEDVARECKHHSLSRGSNVVFHYHSLSFDL